MAYLTTRPYALHRYEGRTLHSLGASVYVKATSGQTGGAFCLMEVVFPPGYATPLHIHYAEDVAIYVLEGKLKVYWGREAMEAVAGSYFFQPQGIPHGFRVEGLSPTRILYLTAPGGLDQFVAEQGLLASDPECGTASARYKIEIVGPLPEVSGQA